MRVSPLPSHAEAAVMAEQVARHFFTICPTPLGADVMGEPIRMTPEARAFRLAWQYQGGDKVRILRGKLKGRVFTVDQSANDWVTLQEVYTNTHRVQSKRNVEPA